jgi:hypothetical protein
MTNKFSLFLLFTILFGSITQAQSLIWSKSTAPSTISESDRWIKPEKYGVFKLELKEMRDLLNQAPEEFKSNGNAVLVEIPMPDHTFQRFAVYHSSIMEPGLAKQFPEIDTWRGQGIDNPRASVHIDITLQGFHAMILSPEGSVFVDPYAKTTTEYYISYFKNELKAKNKFNEIEVVNGNKGNHVTPVKSYKMGLNKSGSSIAQRSNGTQLKTYRLALAATFEYTTFHGGTVSLALSAMTTTINRVVGVYRKEFGISLTLITTTTNLIYTTSADPYTNSNGSTLLNENQTNVTNVIGSANYDIGHVFSTGGGGVAYLASVCVSSNKARGVTGSSSPVNDAFDIDYVAHEMGHQFGGNHSFNGNTGSCSGGNRNSSTAYEPGSGSTIMAYAGICSPQDLQSNSNAYFHTINFDEIITNITTGAATCGTIVSSGNNLPVANVGTTAHAIPFGTPFFLTGSGTDPDGDSLTYCWEQMNLGASSAPNTPSATGPRFRSYNPSTNPTRFVPNYNSVLNNTVPIGEVLSTAAQTLNFRLTVRDGQALCGGVDYDVNNKVITVTNTGPFAITNAPSLWAVGSSQTLTWSLGGSNAAPINVANVKISLSTDGGLTFPYVLAASTPNDGSQLITLPAALTSQNARLKIEPIGNIFYTISPVFAIDDPSAGSFITIGTGTGSNTSTAFPAPYGNYFGGVKHQFIYRASELSAKGVTAGILTEFGFNVSSLVSGNLNGFSISMKNSTVNDLTSGWQTGLTTVFSSAVYNANIGWNLHPLSPGFYWDGTSNIIVEVCFNNNNGGVTGNTLTAITAGLPAGTSRWFRADNTASLCSGTAVTTTGNTSRPNARMFVITAPTVSASSLSFSNITNTSVTLNWTKGNGGRRIVIARLTSNPAIVPTHLNDYLSSSFFGMGQQTGNNNFCVYNDSGNTVTVTGLSMVSNYSFDVYEYNGINGNHVYRITSPLTGNITTLPVKLLSFDAQKDESKVILNWTTSSEINSEIFEIERQQNTEDFNKIGQVKAAGNSNNKRFYQFNDYNYENESEIFYRLKMIDKDGSFEYSPIVSIQLSDINNEVKVSPNPSNGLIEMNWINKAAGFSYEMKDLNGMVLFKGIANKNPEQIQISEKHKGLFILEFKSEDQIIRKKIILE